MSHIVSPWIYNTVATAVCLFFPRWKKALLIFILITVYIVIHGFTKYNFASLAPSDTRRLRLYTMMGYNSVGHLGPLKCYTFENCLLRVRRRRKQRAKPERLSWIIRWQELSYMVRNSRSQDKPCEHTCGTSRDNRDVDLGIPTAAGKKGWH